MNLCIFCDPVCAFCDKCGGPVKQEEPHLHPLISLIQDYDKYSEILINPNNC